MFSTKGYHAASVQDVADEVGILKGSLYHHVASKEELLYLCVKEPIVQLYRELETIVASETSATEKLQRAIRAHLDAFDRHYPHLFVYLRETRDLSERFPEATNLSPKQYELFWQKILREGMKSGEFRADLDVKVISYGLLGMLNWLYKWYEPDGRLTVGEVARHFTDLALGGLRPAS